MCSVSIAHRSVFVLSLSLSLSIYFILRARAQRCVPSCERTACRNSDKLSSPDRSLSKTSGEHRHHSTTCHAAAPARAGQSVHHKHWPALALKAARTLPNLGAGRMPAAHLHLQGFCQFFDTTGKREKKHLAARTRNWESAHSLKFMRS